METKNIIKMEECKFIALAETIRNGGEIETTDSDGMKIRIKIPAPQREEITNNC